MDNASMADLDLVNAQSIEVKEAMLRVCHTFFANEYHYSETEEAFELLLRDVRADIPMRL